MFQKARLIDPDNTNPTLRYGHPCGQLQRTVVVRGVRLRRAADAGWEMAGIVNQTGSGSITLEVWEESYAFEGELITVKK